MVDALAAAGGGIALACCAGAGAPVIRGSLAPCTTNCEQAFTGGMS